MQDTAVSIYQPTQLTDSLGFASPTCHDYTNGKVVVVAQGGQPGYTYTFSNTLINNTGLDDNLGAGTYAVTITDHYGCLHYDSAILTQPDSVLIEVSPTPIQVKLGDQLQLNTSSNQTETVNYSWTPDFGLSCYDCSDPVFTGVYSQPYHVLATNQDGCIGTFDFTVTVVPVYNIFFPNIFTPGQGGVNAEWQVFGEKHAIKQIEVSVFDRIGEKVFESRDINFTWDGTFKGKQAPEGVYTYMARIVWLNNYTEKLFEGSVTLMR
jgi:gliding motility-associated-like protein